MGRRKLLASLLTCALGATTIVLGGLPDPAGAATQAVNTPMNCTASTPIGNVAVSQDLAITTTAPDGVENARDFTVVASSDAANAPASSSGFSINSMRDLRITIPIPANAAYRSHSLGADGIMPPGAAAPSLSYNAGAGRIELSVPGPIPGGALFKIPTINIGLRSNGANYSTIQPRLASFTTTVNVNFPSPIGAGDVVTTCSPVAPVPALSTTTIIPPDTTAPVVTLSSPANGAVLGLGQPVAASYTCTDPAPGSGVVSCVGTVPNGAPVSTSSLGTKTFSVTGTDAKGNTSTVTNTYTVVDVPVATVTGGSVTEGGALPFTVALSKPAPTPVVLDLVTVDGTATAPGDYTATAATVTFTPGGPLSQTVTVPTVSDNVFEPAETVDLVVADTHGGASVGAGRSGRILDDDPVPVLVAGATTSEGPGAVLTFLVVPSEPTPAPLTVTAEVVDGSATAGSDYLPTGPVDLSWAAGELSARTVTVPVVDDAIGEADVEDLVLRVTQPSGEVTTAVGTIVDDDAPAGPAADLTRDGFTVGDVTVVEGDQGTITVSPMVSLRSPATGEQTVRWRLVARTATSNVDFVAATGTVRLQTGQISKNLAVKIKSDTVPEDAETFLVELYDPVGNVIADRFGTITILDDDSPTAACCVANVTDSTVWESDSGVPFLLVDVTLNRPATTAVSVRLSTTPGTATGTDYNSGVKTVSFKAGQYRKTVKITLRNDAVREGDEYFNLTLSNPTGGVGIGRGSGRVTILDDELQPTAPSSLAATPYAPMPGMVEVGWAPPAADPASPALAVFAYDYRVSTDGGTTWSHWLPTLTGTTGRLMHYCGVGASCDYQIRGWNRRGPGAAAGVTGVGSTDTIAPVVTLDTPADGGNAESWAPLTYRGTLGVDRGDLAAVDVRVSQGGSVVQYFAGSAAGAEWSATSYATLAPGTYQVEVEQTDWLGNVGTDQATIEVRDAVFVSAAGNDASVGSASQPKRTVQAGINAAAASGRTQVAVGIGSFSRSGGVSLANGVAVLGGFNPYTGWERPGSAGTAGTVDPTGTILVGSGTAVLASGTLTASLDGLSVQGTNTGLGAGSSVYGLRAVSGATVTLSRTRVQADPGVPGVNGANGSDGVSGGSGAEGGLGWENCFDVPGRPASPGGAGGGGAASGGVGGSAPCPTQGFLNFGEGGHGNAGATGGGGGGGGGFGGTPSFSLTCGNGDPGGGGGGGAAGASGSSAGAGGAGGSAGLTWSSTSGTTGASGSPGRAGGGGGGGGGQGGGASGAWVCAGWDRGGGGGGGGGAGGAGTGGGAGTAGGGSFGIYVRNATVHLGTDVTVAAANGGKGGDGGRGGNGGPGGPGGRGGSVSSAANNGAGVGNATPAPILNLNVCGLGFYACFPDGGPGGAGGGGGAGGAGAGGGGGAGGPSAAVYHSGTGTVTGYGTASTTRGAGGAGGLPGAFGQAAQGGGGGDIAGGAWTTAPNPGAPGGSSGAGALGGAGGAGLACRVVLAGACVTS